MKMILSADLPHIKDVNFFINYVSKLIETDMNNGIKLFMQVLLTRIPVLTGFLRGSFTPVADRFGVQNNVSPINTRPMFYKKNLLKTPTSGQGFTKAKLIKSGTLIMFQINVDIEYMAINDFNSRGSGTPWQAIDSATQAFVIYMQSIGDRLPILTPVLSTYTIRLEGKSISQTIREKKF
jgi:hypothetical protein